MQACVPRLASFTDLMPGLTALRCYRFRTDFSHDLFAGLSVAADALPVSIAYAELAGLSPAVGLNVIVSVSTACSGWVKPSHP